MKVYVVQNSDAMLLAVFEKKRSAKLFVKNIGLKRWRETWHVEEVELDSVEPWLMQGGDEYRMKKRGVK